MTDNLGTNMIGGASVIESFGRIHALITRFSWGYLTFVSIQFLQLLK